MFWYTCMQCSFWSSFNCLSTIFAQTFCMPISLIIFQILSFFSCPADLQSFEVNWQSPHATCLMLTSVLLVEGLPLSHFSPPWTPSLNLLCLLKTLVHNSVISMHCRNIGWIEMILNLILLWQWISWQPSLLFLPSEPRYQHIYGK